MYKARDQNSILKELQDWSELDISRVEGTFENDVLASNSIEFSKTEIELEQLCKAAFGDTAWDEFLTMRAAESGVIRKEAVQAIGVVTVTGNGTVPQGSRFATTSGVLFETTQAVTIKGSGTVPVRALTAGKVGNVAAGTITNIPMSIPGITSVTNTKETTDGYDREDDESLRERYLTHVRTPGTSGNKYHYLEWATAVEGVGAAKVIPTWNGPTTVKVIIVDSNYGAASETLVQKVRDYIESVRPIGAVVTVISAVPKVINVAAAITGAVNEERFTLAVKNYFIQLEKNSIAGNSISNTVSIAKVGALLLDSAGADDYTALKLNGGTTNILLKEEEIASLGTVTLT